MDSQEVLEHGLSDSSNTWNWQRIAKRIRVPLGFLFAVVYMYLARPTIASILAGAAIACIGLWIRGFASGYVKKNEELATTGPYAYTRNPLYLGSIVIAIGFAVAAMSLWIGIVLVLMYLAIYIPVIKGEEKFLASKFDGFGEYCKAVPRLFPRITPAHIGKQGDGCFSRELYLKHREYNATVGAVAVVIALAIKLVWFANVR